MDVNMSVSPPPGRELDRLGGPSVFFLGSSEVQAIHQARPDVLWVGMTVPKQEKWVHRHRDRLDVRFIFTPPI